MAGGSFFETKEYLAARAKAIEYLEDRLIKEVVDFPVARKSTDIDPFETKRWIAYNKYTFKTILHYSDCSDAYHKDDWIIKTVTFP